MTDELHGRTDHLGRYMAGQRRAGLMAGRAPVEATVRQVLGQAEMWDGKDGPMQTISEVLFADDNRTRKVFAPADAEVVEGTTLKGWFNDQKGSFTVAVDRPQNGRERRSQSSGGGGRDDATGRSIERQVAAKCAAEMAAAVGGNGPVVMANFEEFFEAVDKKITGVEQAAKADG